MAALSEGSVKDRLCMLPKTHCTAPAHITSDDLPRFLADLFDCFDEAFARAEHEVKSTLGGCQFVCRTDTAAYSGVVRRGLADVGRHAQGRDCLILAGTATTLGLAPAPVWAERFYRERAVEASIGDTGYRLHHILDLDFWQVYDRQTGRGIQLTHPTLGLPPWDRGSPMRNFLHWHLAKPGCDLIHAGTLGVNGSGILLAGAGGSGKSGTVLAGVLHGLETVGDDYVFAQIGDAVTVHPLFKTLKQDPAGLARLGLSEFRSKTGLNWQGKHQLSIDDVGRKPQPDRIIVRAICVPRIARLGQTRFEPMGSKEAFLALAPSGVSQIPGDRGSMFAFAADLARRLPAYKILLGTDPAEIAAAVKTFLERQPG
jgi:hypothetical protein